MTTATVTLRTPSGVPLWLTKQWQEWVYKTVEESGKSQKLLAQLAGFDPSYLIQMRKGFIPRRDVVESFGAAVGKKDQALLMAGFLPNQKYLGIISRALTK